MAFMIALLILATAAGQAAAHGPEGIRIGIVSDQSGTGMGADRGMRVGVNAYFQSVNDKGGVNGRRLELVIVDDQMVTGKTVDALLKLVEEQKILAIVGSGSPNLAATLPLIKQYKIPFIDPGSGASELRNPPAREVVHIRSSYQQEIDRLVEMLVNSGAKRISVFYDNSPLGTGILNATQVALERHGLLLASKGLYDKVAVPMASALTNIMEGNPEVIVVGAPHPVGSEFVTMARKQGVKAHIAASSFSGGHRLVEAVGPAAEGIIMTRVVPELEDLSLPITRECKEAIQKYPEEVGFNAFTMEGCIAAKSIVMALGSAGNPPTRQGFLASYESMKGADMGGIKLTLTPGNHHGQGNVYLQIVQGGKLVPLKALPDKTETAANK